MVKIVFDRSPNDLGTYDTPDITWYYELYRGRNGTIEPVQVKQFRKADKRIEFHDTVPADGTYVYAVRGLRLVGQPLGKQAEPGFTDKVLKFLAGFVSTSRLDRRAAGDRPRRRRRPSAQPRGEHLSRHQRAGERSERSGADLRQHASAAAAAAGEPGRAPVHR